MSVATIEKTDSSEQFVIPADYVSLALQHLTALTVAVPSTKGMGPKERAQRLHAEMEKRIELAKNVEQFLRKHRPW